MPGCSISAASTPSNAPASISRILRQPPRCLGWCADHDDGALDLGGAQRRTQPEDNRDAGDRDQVVAAGVPDLRQRVVLAERRDHRATAPRRGAKRRLEAVRRSLDLEARALEVIGQRAMGVRLLVVELGAGVDVEREGAQPLGRCVDCVEGGLFGVGEEQGGSVLSCCRFRDPYTTAQERSAGRRSGARW
jgi:hypothetical protein